MIWNLRTWVPMMRRVMLMRVAKIWRRQTSGMRLEVARSGK